MKKNKYLPNNWKLYKDAPDNHFFDHPFDEFMTWKVAGWELPSSVCCIIRETDQKTKKVKEYVYSRPYHAQRRINKLMNSKKEFTVVDEVTVHQMYPDSK